MMLMIALGMTNMVIAQKDKEKEAPKPNVNKSLNLIRQGKFDEAKVIADGVPTHSKTRDDAKAWFCRGLVYAAMDTSSKYTGGATDNTKIAGEAFAKAKEISGPKSILLSVLDNGETLLLPSAIERLNGRFLNNGDKLFKQEKFKEAVTQFEKGLDLMPDSSIFQYAGYSAYNAEDMDKAALYIGKYMEMGGKNEQATKLRLAIFSEVKKDHEKSLGAATEAMKLFPNNPDFRKVQLNSLINLKRYEEATENLKSALKADPKDVESQFLMGALYEELNNRPEAKKYFEEAHRIDPKHLASALAVAKIQDGEGYRAVKIEMDKLDYKKDKAKLEALDKEYVAKMNEAMLRWEDVSKIDPNHVDVLGNLYILYGQLEMKDKLSATISRMKANGMEVD
jgi:tetratricopeptide (TPR) repeat protein